MPETFSHKGLYGRMKRTVGVLAVGTVWGSLGGLAVGMAVSLIAGIFYSNAGELTVGMLAVCGLLGSMFGRAMDDFLYADIAVSGRLLPIHKSTENNYYPLHFKRIPYQMPLTLLPETTTGNVALTHDRAPARPAPFELPAFIIAATHAPLAVLTGVAGGFES